MRTLIGAAEPPERPLVPAVVTPWPSTTTLTWTTRPVRCQMPLDPDAVVWWFKHEEIN